MNLQPVPFHLGYRRSLDGLRAISIILVLLDHGKIVPEMFGFIGVNTFFVLSGFLITTLLMAEWKERGTIDLGYFYLRRMLRLYPALLAMLLAFGIYAWLTNSGKSLATDLHEILWALFYLTNLVKIFGADPGFNLGHTWSLGVEEQFYLIWPVLLLFLLPRNSRGSLACWIFLGVVLSVSLRFYLLAASLTPAVDPDRMVYGLDTRADSLLMGCLAAVLVSSGFLTQLPDRKLVSGLLAWGLLLGLLSLGFCRRTPVFICGGWLLASALAAALIMQLVAAVRTPLHYLLENPVMVYIGQISYGLYLWHVPILGALKRYDLPWQNLKYLAFVFPVVLASYYFIEKPCLQLKKKFQKVS